MGMSLGRRCRSQPRNPAAVAPNPDPSRWIPIKILKINGYLIAEIQYLDCTNFDGRKIMVFCGIDQLPERLDPHFRDDPGSPVARFQPTPRGWTAARGAATRGLL